MLQALLMLVLLATYGTTAVYLVQRIINDVNKLAEVEMPLEFATLELEINAGETARGVLEYIDVQDVKSLDLIRDSENDFARYMEQYEDLAETDEERELGGKVKKLYQEFTKLGNEIIDAAESRVAILEPFREEVEALDTIFEKELIGRSVPISKQIHAPLI